MNELDKHSKSNPFKVPDNYFDDFEEQLMKKIDSIEIKQNGQWKIASFKPFLAIAAGFLVVMSMWFLLLNQFDKKEEVVVQTNSVEESIYTYFESVNSDELINIITSEEFVNQDFALDMEVDTDLIIDQVDESNIIDEI